MALKKYEMVIDEDDAFLGVHTLSIVDDPAIEVGFVALKKDQKTNLSLAKVDEEKRLLIGAALIPDKLIFRIDETDPEGFNIFFSKDTIEKAAHLFLKRNAHQNSNDNHDGEKLKGVTVVESWIKEHPTNDKSSIYGFEELPVGTWFTAMKVDNDEEWAKIKNGEREGFSIEGHFVQKVVASKQGDVYQQLLDQLTDLLK